ncbi:DUF4176 domain-containing protein [Erysipelotrichaceae bacterium 51-3]|uniref:DUF4176 domain-containing protein n=1 Tax=Allobaculum sp. JKK-2023 TaxID=3108943 RepID=UPI002B055B9F|nr:DUF4176 domain-containing protein [Allobaculum sp. JKK-2023]
MQKEILPLGSVVTLNEGKKRLMIVGRLQKHLASGKIYDYCAVLWPEGMIDSDRTYLFNHQDVDQVWFIGLQDQEEFAFRNQLDWYDAHLEVDER